jgi:hypothetical protein
VVDVSLAQHCTTIHPPASNNVTTGEEIKLIHGNEGELKVGLEKRNLQGLDGEINALVFVIRLNFCCCW